MRSPTAPYLCFSTQVNRHGVFFIFSFIPLKSTFILNQQFNYCHLNTHIKSRLIPQKSPWNKPASTQKYVSELNVNQRSFFSTFISESYYPCFGAVFYIKKQIIAFQFASLFFLHLYPKYRKLVKVNFLHLSEL